MMLRPLALLIAFLSLAGAASADCTVHYKAKRDNPLQLQAGSASLPAAACASPQAAAAALAPMLAGQGWTLLAITAIIPSG
ncbi:MAG: hypothetical protein U1E48_12275 [Paracoccaceae bacterium]